MLFRSISLLFLMLFTGCSSLHVMSHVPLSTMSRLSAMKLAEIEPAQLRVAARMPEHFEPRKDGVLQDIREVAGMVDVAVVHDMSLPALPPSVERRHRLGR